MSRYSQRDLYGGAITVILPTEYIDASDIRQIPDHQEVFLSPSTLSSIIFEINAYVSRPTDNEAAHFHFTDTISPPDHLAEPLHPAQTVSFFSNNNLAGCQTLILHGEIMSPDPPPRRNNAVDSSMTQSTAPTNGDVVQNSTTTTTTYVIQFLVRIPEHTTDLCVRFNVPYKELTSQQARDAEKGLANEHMARIVSSLTVRDWNLFGAD